MTICLPELTKPAFYLMERFRRTAGDTKANWELDDSNLLFSNVDVAEFANSAVTEYHRRRPVVDWFSPITQFPLTIGQKSYLKDPRILNVQDVRIDGKPITKILRDEFDLIGASQVNGEEVIDVDDETDPIDALDDCGVSPLGRPTVYMEDEYYIHVKQVPDKSYLMTLSCEVLPYQEITVNNCKSVLLMVPAQDVEALIWWMEFLAWSRRDADTLDPNRAKNARALFDDLVGQRWSSLQEQELMMMANRPLKTKTYYK